jgi:hypothetical protein
MRRRALDRDRAATVPRPRRARSAFRGRDPLRGAAGEVPDDETPAGRIVLPHTDRVPGVAVASWLAMALQLLTERTARPATSIPTRWAARIPRRPPRTPSGAGARRASRRSGDCGASRDARPTCPPP